MTFFGLHRLTPANIADHNVAFEFVYGFEFVHGFEFVQYMVLYLYMILSLYMVINIGLNQPT